MRAIALVRRYLILSPGLEGDSSLQISVHVQKIPWITTVMDFSEDPFQTFLHQSVLCPENEIAWERWEKEFRAQVLRRCILGSG